MLTIPIPADEEQRLVDFSQLGMLLTEPDAVLDAVTRELTRIFEVPTAAISFIDRDTQYYKAAVGVPEPFATTRVEPRDMSICSFVVGNNDLMVVEDLASDQRFRQSAAVTDLGVRFYAGAPLRADSGRAVGSLCILDNRPRSISDREREMLRMVAEGVMAQVKLQVASRRMLEYATRIEEELQRAVKVQRFLLPPSPIKESGWVIQHLYRPVAHLGGDFLDVVTKQDGRIAVLIADVTGHGTDAALTAAMAKTAFSRAVNESSHTNEILAWMNGELIPVIPPGQFISAIATILDNKSGKIEMSSAGHPYPIVVTPDNTSPVDFETNLLLGVDAQATFDHRVAIQLKPCDRLLCFTDGAIEAVAATDKSDQLGVQRLCEYTHQAAWDDQNEFLGGIYERIIGFAGGQIDDDVALLEFKTGS